MNNCPFCNKKISIIKDRIYWRDLDDDIRIYISGSDIKDEDNPCWRIECDENKNGCGAYLIADSYSELIIKWNKRIKKED